MKPQMDERWRRKGASTVEYIVVLAAVVILAMAVYHTLSGDEMAGMIMEKIQAAIDGDLTGDGASPGTGGGSSTEETDTKQSPSPKGDSPSPPKEKDENPALQFAKGAGDVALDFIGFYDAKAAITGVDENGNKIGWGERIFRGALVVPIAKPVKGGKMALKYGDKALTAGKNNLDKLTRKGKKTACGCPKKRQQPDQHLTKAEKEKYKDDLATQKSISKKRHKEKQRQEQERKKGDTAEKQFDIKNSSKRMFKYSWEGKSSVMYQQPDGTWWAKDTTGHGDSAYKVFQETGKEFKWLYDADKNGNKIVGKHKGEKGKIIKKSTGKFMDKR